MATPGEGRRHLDLYATPPGLARAICERLADGRHGLRPREIIEPSAGTGSFVEAARSVWPAAHVTAVEIDEQHRAACLSAGAEVFLHGAWTDHARQLAHGQDPDRPPTRLILGNPPYRHAREHVEAALELLLPGEHLAFLLRLAFLGARSRVDFWRRPGLLRVLPVIPRPSFTGTGSDATEYGAFVWRKGWRGLPRIGKPVTWSKLPRQLVERAGRAA